MCREKQDNLANVKASTYIFAFWSAQAKYTTVMWTMQISRTTLRSANNNIIESTRPTV